MASAVDGIETLMRVDDDIPPAMQRIVADPAFAQLVEALTEAIVAGRRVFLTGCGATGRLAILLEAAWRTFWQELRASWPSLHATLPNREDTFVSVMAGGDHALIRSVEGFEDSTDLGRHQLKEGYYRRRRSWRHRRRRDFVCDRHRLQGWRLWARVFLPQQSDGSAPQHVARRAR